MSSNKPFRTVTGAELKELLKKTEYLYVTVDSRRYCRSALRLDKSTFISDVELCTDQFSYKYLIDENYEQTIYIEQIIKQPVGGTVDASA